MDIKTVKNLLKNYGIRPFKGLGQNFLINKRVLKKIIKAAKLSKNDVVLEIGPGIGNLTLELAKKAKKVIAIEKDKKMCEVLKEVLDCQNIGNVKIIKGDVLKIKNGSMVKWLNNYKVVANLPYYITSPVIRKFLEIENQPKEIVLMVQKEVARRICSQPPKMSILAVSVQFYAEPKIISFVSKKSFWPQPKVDSAIIKITPKKISTRTVLVDSFFKIVKAGFSHPRKQLINNFSKELKMSKEKVKKWLLKNGIQPIQRAETLSVKDWLKLVKGYNN
ncbi:MAG: 16S rRNA (adenine(1518)-N(6)/adenine(1519)-N(6))-dimethyltransferase RsmA [Candidatus Nealsonbacteria bacterium]